MSFNLGRLGVSFGTLGVLWALAAAGPPIVANQTIDFGRLTLAGAGGTAPANVGGAITSASIDSGTNANHWQISSAGVITPSAAGVLAGLSASYTLGMTFGGVSATITINTAGASLPTGYSVLTEAEILAVFALGTVTVSGKTLYGRTASLTGLGVGSTTFKNRAWTSNVTFTSHNSSAPMQLDAIDINNVQCFTLSGIKLAQAAANSTTLCAIRGLSDSIVISGNEICSTTVVNPNADYSGGFFTNFNAIQTSSSGGVPIGVTITGNNIHDVRTGMDVNVSGALTITTNTISRFYEDAIKVGHQTGNSAATNINGNDINHPFGRSTDTAPPHSDAIQLLGSTAEDWANITIKMNTIWRGNARGTMQAIFLDDMGSGLYYTANIQSNMIGSGVQNSIYVDRAKNCLTQNNTVSGPSDDPYTGSARSTVATITIGATQTSGTNITIDNIAEAFTLNGTIANDNNITTGLLGATIPLASVFDGPTFQPDILADLLTFYSMKVGGSADNTYNAGAIGTGYSNFTTRVYTAPRSSVATPSDRIEFSEMFGVMISKQSTGNNILPGLLEAA